MSEQELYPNRARVDAMAKRLSGVLTESQLADLRFIGDGVDTFGDVKDTDEMTEAEEDSYRLQRIMWDTIRRALNLIEALSGEKVPPPSRS